MADPQDRLRELIADAVKDRIWVTFRAADNHLSSRTGTPEEIADAVIALGEVHESFEVRKDDDAGGWVAYPGDRESAAAHAAKTGGTAYTRYSIQILRAFPVGGSE